MAKVLVAGIVHQCGRDLFEARDDIAYEVLDEMSEADIAARIADLDALVVRSTPVGAETIAKATRLKVVSRFGVGYDAIDVAALTRAGIPLAVIGEANAASVAEHTLGLMIAVARQFRRHDRAVRDRNYRDLDPDAQSDLAGKTVLIVGFGRIGSRVAPRCKAFDMKVIAADPYIPRETVESKGHRYVADFREALGDADFVTLHMPGIHDGSTVMAAPELNAMKPGAYLINTARGTLVEEAALAAALRSGRLRAAGIDVLRQEPPAPDCPLLALDNVILTPHSATLTKECTRRVSMTCVQNALDAIDGCLRPEYVVNKEVLG